jgi:hypothetical protein
VSALDPIADLVRRAEDAASDPESVGNALAELLSTDPRVGASTALGILARQPRIKPSFGLVIDPDGVALLRWRQRVAAAAALLESPALDRIFDELYEELAESQEFAHDVLRDSCIPTDITLSHRARLLRLIP